MTSEPRRERGGAEAWPEKVYRREMERIDRRARLWRKIYAFGAGLELTLSVDFLVTREWLTAAYFAGCAAMSLLAAREGR